MSAAEWAVPEQLVNALRDGGLSDAYIVGYLQSLLEIYAIHSSDMRVSLESHLAGVLEDTKAAA